MGFKKVAIGGLPFLSLLPGCILLLSACGLVPDSPLRSACIFFYLPAFSFGALAQSFWGLPGLVITVLVVGLAWSAFIFYVLTEIRNVFAAEDFDWAGFKCGMIVGVVPGLLFGWRLWIRNYTVVGFLKCFLLAWLVNGFGIGLYMGKCWCRHKD